MGRGNWWGHDCPDALFVAGVDSNDGAVVDSFPYGRRDGWELGLEPGCDVTPPEAPVIDLPEEGMTLLTDFPLFVGTAEAGSLVEVFEGGTALGHDQASVDGRFAFAADVVMSRGPHSVVAIATDRFGHTSELSAVRSFVLQSVDATHPLQDERGKFRIVGLSVAPNPFDPPAEVNSLNALVEVDSVKGLNGNSPNHLFFAMTKRVILDPLTLEPVRTVYGVTELDREADKPLTVSVVDAWDGTDETGALVERYRGYPMDIEIMVARTYLGNGSGARCSIDEERLSDDMMQSAFEPLFFTSLQWQMMLLRGCMVAKRELLFTRLAAGIWAAIDKLEWDPLHVCAPDCNRAEVACRLTLLDSTYPFTMQEDDQGACGECRKICGENCTKPGMTCTWPNGPLPASHQSYPCKYWEYNLKTMPAPLPFDKVKTNAICFHPNVTYATCSLVQGPDRILCDACEGDACSSCVICGYGCPPTDRFEIRAFPSTALTCPASDIFPIYPD